MYVIAEHKIVKWESPENIDQLILLNSTKVSFVRQEPSKRAHRWSNTFDSFK